jgi:hypothetical protein
MRRPRILPRTRIYLGCEGESEQSYGARLGQIADSASLHLHIDNDVLRPGGGDPLALVELAVRRIAEREKRRGAFEFRAILLDRDKLGQNPDRDNRIDPLAAATGLTLIWQKPCHEGFLLRHFAGHETARPATADIAMQELKRIWPDYYKAMPAIQLAVRIDIEDIRRASVVEPQFASFLHQIGLPRL